MSAMLALTADALHERLATQLAPTLLEVIDESAAHRLGAPE